MPNATVRANARTLPEADDEIITTAEQWAAFDFEPWTHTEDEWKPPTGAEWPDHIRSFFPYVRLAWETLFRTKAELQTIAEGLDGEPLENLLTGIADSKKFFDNFVKILGGAEARLLCAASAVELSEEAAR
jgi:hypothetical protein